MPVQHLPGHDLRHRRSTRRRILFGILARCLMTLVAAASPVEAQTTDARKWEIEFHGGGVWPTSPTGGTVSLPGPGQVFTTATGATLPPPSSRRQSSWYFGDGAVLFNQAASALANQATIALALPWRIATLDPVLGRSLGEWRRGGSFGASVSRTLTPRFGAELRFNYNLARLRITQPNSDAIEATRVSQRREHGG